MSGKTCGVNEGRLVTKRGDLESAFREGLRWTLGRILLHTTHSTPAAITDEHIDELLEAVRRFAERRDIAAFHGSRERYRGRAKTWTTHIHRLGAGGRPGRPAVRARGADGPRTHTTQGSAL
jgi:hypothetical protein